jgi:hypothetical protein
MDPDRVREIVAGIPRGSWMSYGDVARAAGGTDVHARALNQRFIREEMPGATFEYTTQLVEGEAAFLEWTARSESVRVSDGADSFFIQDGLVVAQTSPYTVESLG